MQKLLQHLIGMILMTITTLAVATPITSGTMHAKQDNQTLAAYLAEPEHIKQPWVLVNKDYDALRHVSIETYTLTSQTWPKPGMDSHTMLWQHTFILYRPDVITTDQALLFVSGGTRYSKPQRKVMPPNQLDFARIAAETHSAVFSLQDVPNQYLTFDDGIPRKEDGIVAYTWNRYLDDPDNNSYWPLHLPMTKAVIKAMDAAQQILLKNNNISINHFVVSGASKRGWATWLAALSDNRINAIVPIVIDILNTQKNIDHIYESYDHHWPPAFHDYVDAKVTDRIHTPAFSRLMTIEDPLSYLNCAECDGYKKRLSIPKYIISSSGDDFFVPDSLNLYLDKLPGETKVRVVPNQSHYIDMKVVEASLLPYYRTVIHNTERPTLTWHVDASGKLQQIITNKKPIRVILWEAENPNARDFRLAAHITYSATELKGNCANNQCQYMVHITTPAKGWKSSFVEVTFQDNEEPMILTTSAYVTGAS